MIELKLKFQQHSTGLGVQIEPTAPIGTEAEAALADAFMKAAPRLVQELSKVVFGDKATSYVVDGRPQSN